VHQRALAPQQLEPLLESAMPAPVEGRGKGGADVALTPRACAASAAAALAPSELRDALAIECCSHDLLRWIEAGERRGELIAPLLLGDFVKAPLTQALLPSCRAPSGFVAQSTRLGDRGQGGVPAQRMLRVVSRKLDLIDFAAAVMDLGSPPGNRLEALQGKQKGLHSIRVNDQWRIVFRWTDEAPGDVDVRDYH
jgi:proteic killer suppression protein